MRIPLAAAAYALCVFALAANPETRRLPSVDVETPRGVFSITDLQQTVGRDEPRALTGKISNHTGVWWDDVAFDVVPTDSRGTTFKPGALSIGNFAANETLPFRITLDQHYDHRSVRFAFRYVNGDAQPLKP